MSNDNVNQLKSELGKTKSALKDAQDAQVRLEQAVESNNEVIKDLNNKLAEYEANRIELEQQLVNAQQAKAMEFGLEPAQLALLVLQAVPLCKNVNGTHFAPKKVDEEIRSITEHMIPPAIQVVRETLNQLAKLKMN